MSEKPSIFGHNLRKRLAFGAPVWTNGGMEAEPAETLPELEALAALTATELRGLYETLFTRRPPSRASADFLRGNVAWAIHARRLKEDPAVLRNKLIKAGDTTIPSRQAHSPGTRLTREWQGDTYEVTVLKRGYLWQGRTYRSLTEIATRITGTKWSGPRFFGLTKRAS